MPPQVAAEVRALLAQHDAEERAGGRFLAQAPALSADADTDRRQQRLGPWLLVAPLGSGGMSDVWEARRADGAYEARVAVKVLRLPGDSPLLQHVVQEQRLLARLNHPHIARLLDAGSTPDGQPYVVLEAVDGQPIDVACRSLPLSARLQYFLQLADAVAHAHRQQLIHRDLKPANVLVTPEGQVKLLDFGIAQALDHATPPTPGMPGAWRPLSAACASPEQVRGEAVTVATDVYALGALLHRMLTGRPATGLLARDSRQALDAVLQDPPTPPSRAAALARAATVSAPDPRTNLGAAPAHPPDTCDALPPRALAGDLDCIVLKALAKAPAARYRSVEALVADIRAHLSLHPVTARPRTPLYLASRFVRRHAGAVAGGVMALLAIVAGLGAAAWQARDAAAALALAALALALGVSTWQARRAAAARDDARTRLTETSGLVRDVVMRYADTVTYLPGGLRMKADMLADTIAALQRLLASAPGDAALAGELAKALSRLADLQLADNDATLAQPEEAEHNAEAALALFPRGEAAHRGDPAYPMWWARALRARRLSLRRKGDVHGVLDVAQRTCSLLQTARQQFPTDRALLAEYGSALIGVGQACDTWISASLEQSERALQVFAEAESVFQQLLKDQPEDGDTLYQLGTIAGAQLIVQHKQGRLGEAAAHGRRAVAYRESALRLKPEHIAYREGAAGEGNNLTSVLLAAGDVAEALMVSARTEALTLSLLNEDPGVPTWVARRQLFALHRGRALLHAGYPEQALPRLQDALDGMARADGHAGWRRRGLCQLERARCLSQLGQEAAVAEALEAARADLKQAVATNPGDAEAAGWLAQARQYMPDRRPAERPSG
jgi:tetratricopeptide (TPR) repeat protein